MTNKDLKFKCFIKGELLSNAKTFDMNDVNIDPMSIPDFDIALPYLMLQDADKTDIYAGDVLCLVITDDLMDIHKDGFSNSNCGKHIKAHPDITEMYIACNPPKENLSPVPFLYTVYFAHNHKIERWNDDDSESDDNSVRANCRGEDTMFPKYIIFKGAKIIANLYETPDFLENL